MGYKDISVKMFPESLKDEKSVFDRAVEFTLGVEGGYFRNKVSGKESNHGITLPILRIARKRGIVPKQRSLKNLTQSEAKSIYRNFFWKQELEELPSPLAVAVFDASVNMGTTQAYKILQNAVNSFGIGLKVDGILGPESMEMAKEVIEAKGNDLYDRFVEKNGEYYDSIVKNNPKLSVFRNGWKNRLKKRNEFIKTAYPEKAEASHP